MRPVDLLELKKVVVEILDFRLRATNLFQHPGQLPAGVFAVVALIGKVSVKLTLNIHEDRFAASKFDPIPIPDEIWSVEGNTTAGFDLSNELLQKLTGGMRNMLDNRHRDHNIVLA